MAARTVSARHADDAVRNWSKLVNLYPSDVGYRQQLAVANLNLAVFYGLTGTPPFAVGPAFAWLTGILSAFSLLLFAYVLSRLAVARRIVE